MTDPDPQDRPPPETEWWRRGVVYQIYPRSFADSDGDGTGDIEGIRSRLPYLRDLGVDAVWVCPWYTSPMNDGGYDVADYRDINELFGTLADAEALVGSAHDHGIRIIVDLVPNHTSSEHPWFREALAAGPGSRERDRYIFRPGRGADGSQPPTNWTSVFGGPAWTRVDDGEWYLHLFDPTQPDLDWRNEDVRSEFDDIFRFWIERGVDGFRIDVAHGMEKDREFPDVEVGTAILESTFPIGHPHWDRDGVHEINRRWRSVLDESGRDVMMIAEAWVHPDRLSLYLRADEYHQSFNFDFLTAPWERVAAQEAIDRAIRAAKSVGSTPTWTLSNHDVMRHATRFGLPAGTNWRTWPVTGPHELLDPELGLRRARAAALLLMALPGSLYLYQGEELGLPDVWDLPAEALDDPVWENSGHTQKGRDGCRVPLPWSTSGPSLGFGDGRPWLPQPDEFADLSVEAQTGAEGSTLELYRTALSLRRRHLARDEQFAWASGVDSDDSVVAFDRRDVRCMVHFGPAASSVDLPAGEVLLSSVPLVDGRLPGDATVWIAR